MLSPGEEVLVGVEGTGAGKASPGERWTFFWSSFALDIVAVLEARRRRWGILAEDEGGQFI